MTRSPRQLRPAVLAAVTIALCATPVAAAHDDRAVARIAPAHHVAGLTGGELLGEAWAGAYTMQAGDPRVRARRWGRKATCWRCGPVARP
jgi:hypothetical protein